MTLTTDRFNEIYENPEQCSYSEIQEMAAMLANREAQPVLYASEETLAYAKEGEKSLVTWSEPMGDAVIPLFTAPPAPAYPESLPCPVHLLPGLKFGKGVPTRSMLDALVRRAEYESEREAMTPEQKAEDDARIEAFKALLPRPPAPAVPDGWIACSERMPEPNKYVQVSNGVWVGIGMYNDADHFEDDERWQDEHHGFIDLLYHPVTHWMPLPAAPEGGK